MAVIYLSVWRDNVYSSNADEIHYRIRENGLFGPLVTEGLATSRPNAPVEIYVNRLVEPFLESSFSTATGLTTSPNAMREVYLYQVNPNTSETLLGDYVVLRDYAGDWDGSETILSDPVRKEISAKMLVPFTAALAYDKIIKFQAS